MNALSPICIEIRIANACKPHAVITLLSSTGTDWCMHDRHEPEIRNNCLPSLILLFYRGVDSSSTGVVWEFSRALSVPTCDDRLATRLGSCSVDRPEAACLVEATSNL